MEVIMTGKLYHAMRMSLFLVVALVWAGVVEAQQLRIEQNVRPSLDSIRHLINAAMERDDQSALRTLNQALLDTVIGKTMSGGYITDVAGRVYNMGVLDMPYVLGTTHARMLLTVESLNRLADEYAGEVLIIMMIARTDADRILADLEGANEELVVVIEEGVPKLGEGPTNNRIMGLLGYPITYYVRADRSIADIQFGQYVDQDRAYRLRRKKVRMLLKGRL